MNLFNVTPQPDTTPFAHDSGNNADRLLFVCTKTIHDGQGEGITAVTYNSVVATLIPNSTIEAASGSRYTAVKWWLLIAPATGPNMVAVSTTGTILSAEVTAITLDNAPQTSPVLGTPATGNGTSSSTLSATRTSTEENSWYLMGATIRGGDTAPFAPVSGTELTDGVTGANAFLDLGYTDLYGITTTIGSYTLSSTAQVADYWVASMIEVSAGGSTPQPGTIMNLLQQNNLGANLLNGVLQ